MPVEKLEAAVRNRQQDRILAPQARPRREGLMLWAITIAVFLAIATIALLLFLIYSQREQIRKALKEKRNEKRIPTEVELELFSPNEPILYEKSLTENACGHGARILSRKHWQRHDHVLVKLPQKAQPSRARIAYCDTLPGDAFAIGLHFPSAVGDWLISANDMLNGERSHLYRK
jgi:hypothetical protein